MPHFSVGDIPISPQFKRKAIFYLRKISFVALSLQFQGPFPIEFPRAFPFFFSFHVAYFDPHDVHIFLKIVAYNNRSGHHFLKSCNFETNLTQGVDGRAFF